MYELIMLHEAQHCRQGPIDKSLLGDSIALKFDGLAREIDADKVAIATFRDRHAATPELAEQAIQEFHYARSIANIRNSAGMEEGPDSYLTHGTSIFDSGQMPNGQKIEAADIILATKTLAAMNDVVIALSYGIYFSILTSDPEYTAYKHNNNISEFDLLSGGDFLNRKYPLLQYANIKFMRDTLATLVDDVSKPDNGQRPSIILKLMDDYIEAFDYFAPGAARHPLVLAYQESLGKAAKDLKEQAATTPLKTDIENSPLGSCEPLNIDPGMTSEEILKNIEIHRICRLEARIKMLGESFENKRSGQPPPPLDHSFHSFFK